MRRTLQPTSRTGSYTRKHTTPDHRREHGSLKRELECGADTRRWAVSSCRPRFARIPAPSIQFCACRAVVRSCCFLSAPIVNFSPSLFWFICYQGLRMVTAVNSSTTCSAGFWFASAWLGSVAQVHPLVPRFNGRPLTRNVNVGRGPIS